MVRFYCHAISCALARRGVRRGAGGRDQQQQRQSPARVGVVVRRSIGHTQFRFFPTFSSFRHEPKRLATDRGREAPTCAATSSVTGCCDVHDCVRDQASNVIFCATTTKSRVRSGLVVGRTIQRRKTPASPSPPPAAAAAAATSRLVTSPAAGPLSAALLAIDIGDD